MPAELSGAGTSTVIVTADGVRSNSTTVVLSGSLPAPSPSPSPSPRPTPTPTPTRLPLQRPLQRLHQRPRPRVHQRQHRHPPLLLLLHSTPTPTPSPSPTPSPTPTPTPNPSPVASTRVVISQIFGGGGNSGAPFRNDFIEDLQQRQLARRSNWMVSTICERHCIFVVGDASYFRCAVTRSILSGSGRFGRK